MKRFQRKEKMDTRYRLKSPFVFEGVSFEKGFPVKRIQNEFFLISTPKGSPAKVKYAAKNRLIKIPYPEVGCKIFSCRRTDTLNREICHSWESSGEVTALDQFHALRLFKKAEGICGVNGKSPVATKNGLTYRPHGLRQIIYVEEKSL